MEIRSGTRLGPYEVVAPAGAGGMGEVWRAKDTRLEREIAIKVLPAEFAANALLQARFDREAKTISSLNHPHICTLHDVGQESGLQFLVMELIEGETLADRLTKGRLPMDQVLRIGGQVAAALDAAHRKGIVHRDLKPGNVMLTRSGAKLLDFGLARSGAAFSGVAAGDLSATAARPLTQEGTILGTFQYMAPEQLEGQEADARTDIFAFGALLYEMATGQRAFDGKTRTSLIASIVSGTPRPVSELVPMTPPAFEHVVRRCLEKDPDDRWQSAHDIAEQLRWIAEAGSQAGVPAPVIRRRLTRDRLLMAGLAAALAVIAVLAMRDLRRTAEPASAYRLTIPAMTSEYRRAGVAIVSPDGSAVAFTAMDSEFRTRIWVRRLDSFEAKPLEGTGAATFCWSPDGQSIAFLMLGKLLRVPASGGPVQTIADLQELPASAGMTWGKEGVILIGSAESGIHQVPASGGSLQRVTTLDASKHERGHLMPQFLDDGTRFFFIAGVRDPKNADQPKTLYLGSLDGTPPRAIGTVPSKVFPDEASGSILFVRDGALMVSRFDFDAMQFEGEAVPLLEDVFFFDPLGTTGVSISRTGILTAQAPPGGGRMTWLDIAGRTLGVVHGAPAHNQVRFSPDGTRIFAAVRDSKIGTFDLFAFDATRAGSSRLTYSRGWESHPTPSPDGTSIYYATDRVAAPDIAVKVLDSAEEDRLLLTEPALQYPSDVSPDGKLLLYSTDANPAKRSDVWVLPLDGKSKPFAFISTPANEYQARFSLDGRRVAYVSNESGSNEVYVRPFPGPGPARQISQGGGVEPAWSRDGRTIWFRSGNRMMRVSSTFDADPEVVFENADIVGYEVAPDGQRFLAVITSDVDASPPTRVITNWRSLIGSR
ncbi:MAG TPA: protein kinase [Thermoanaerobaculia bacterium]